MSTLTATDEINLWEDELARAVERMEIAEKYDNQGDKAWCEERIRWAQHKLRLLGA